jgi:AcrR family transcriptional regulator
MNNDQKLKAGMPYHHGNLREDFLKAAREELKKNRDWTMRGISACLKLSTGAPYRHFENKAACELAMCRQGWEELKAIAKPDCAPLERLQAWVRDNARLFHLMLTPEYSGAMVSHGIVFHRDFDKLMQQVVRHYWDTCCASHVSEEDGARPTVEIPPSRMEQALNGTA